MTIFDRKNIDLSTRISESNRILSKNPDKIPVIIECLDNELNKQLKKNKFLVPYDVSSSHLLIAVRKNLKINPYEALFLFNDSVLISGTELMGTIYENYKIRNNINDNNNDLFMYITLTKETTFGN